MSTDAERGSGTKGRKGACEGGGRRAGTDCSSLCAAAVTRESNYSECSEGREEQGKKRLSQITPLSTPCLSSCLGFFFF